MSATISSLIPTTKKKSESSAKTEKEKKKKPNQRACILFLRGIRSRSAFHPNGGERQKQQNVMNGFFAFFFQARVRFTASLGTSVVCPFRKVHVTRKCVARERENQRRNSNLRTRGKGCVVLFPSPSVTTAVLLFVG